MSGLVERLEKIKINGDDEKVEGTEEEEEINEEKEDIEQKVVDEVKDKEAKKIIQLKKSNEDIIGNGRQKVLIIGKTGTGKSTLCNVISGLPHNANLFPVSAEAVSCTQETQLADVFFNNQIDKPFRKPFNKRQKNVIFSFLDPFTHLIVSCNKVAF